MIKLLLVVWLLMACLQPVLAEEPSAMMQFQPNLLSIRANQTAKGTVDMVGVTNLFAVDIELSYDANLVEVVDADPNCDGIQVALGSAYLGKDFFTAENQASDGVIKFAGTLIAPETPFSGNGSLITITWRAKNQGQSELKFNKAILIDQQNQALAMELKNGQVRVGSTYRLSGQAQRQGRTNHQDVTVLADGQSVQTAADGRFMLEAMGPYRLIFTSPNYLSAVLEGTVPSNVSAGARVEVGNVTLLNGDVTQDDKIDIFDLARLGSRYGNADLEADLNGDGLVNIFDMAIAAGNYGKQGALSHE